MSINEILPEEILQQIFSYVNVRDRLLFLNKVCSKWAKILNFNDVKFLDVFELHEEICRLDFECPFRLAFNRSADHPIPEIWLTKFVSLILPRFGASLRSLSFQTQRFGNNPFLSIGIEIMELILRNCPKLIELNFLRCQLTPTAVSILPLFTSLKCLKLIRQEVCDEVWPLLVENGLMQLETSSRFGQNFFAGNPGNFETLRFTSTSDEDVGQFPLLEIVTRYPNLIELDIRNLSHLTGEDLFYVSELKLLKILTFSIKERTGVAFFSWICNTCHRLEDLTIFDYQSNGSLKLDGLVHGPGKVKLISLYVTIFQYF